MGGAWDGQRGDEGRVFLIHGCGFGPGVLEVEKTTVEQRGKGGVGLAGVEKGKGRMVELKRAAGPMKSWVGRFLEKV